MSEPYNTIRDTLQDIREDISRRFNHVDQTVGELKTDHKLLWEKFGIMAVDVAVLKEQSTTIKEQVFKTNGRMSKAEEDISNLQLADKDPPSRDPITSPISTPPKSQIAEIIQSINPSAVVVAIGLLALAAWLGWLLGPTNLTKVIQQGK